MIRQHRAPWGRVGHMTPEELLCDYLRALRGARQHDRLTPAGRVLAARMLLRHGWLLVAIERGLKRAA